MIAYTLHSLHLNTSAEMCRHAAMQVSSRVWVVWGIMVAAPAQIASGGITILPLGPYSVQLNLMSLLLAWSVTEIIRYSFFAFKVRPVITVQSQPVML